VSSTTPTPISLQSSKVPESLAVVSHPRIASIDSLRGLVMVIMALDHVRDFFTNATFNPLDLAQTTPALFLTRWITHLCAPVFVLLAGTGAYLYGAQGRSKLEVARFLFTRGLFLVILEFTVIHLGWNLSLDYRFILAQVIWMLGWSMVALAALIFLPMWMLVAIAVFMVGGHNLLDGLMADNLGIPRWLWMILHQPGPIEITPERQFFVLYPLVPWIGVMATGYALGQVFLRPPQERQRWLLGLGLGLTLAFILLRWLNGYGDPRPWLPQSSSVLTFLSFINTEKYPPSLLFLLMTLGPGLILLAVFDRLEMAGLLARPLIIFGQVPLFYYALHLILIHLLAVIFSYIRYGQATWLFGADWIFRFGVPEDYGYELPFVYLIWLGVVAILYLACLWFASVKRRQKESWLSYL
jgi:uncharacterized membrane protein